jgi:hypothetical protein
MMTPEVYAQLSLIARNLALAIPSPLEPWGSPVWVAFLSKVERATR